MLPVVLLTFIAVFLVVVALSQAVNAARHSPAAELKRRLRGMEKGDTFTAEREMRGDLLRQTSALEQFLFQLPFMGPVKSLVDRSGARIKPVAFVALTAALSGTGFIVLLLLKKNFSVALLTGLLIGLLCIVWLQYLKKQRQTKFTEQLPDVLDMVARSLRAGHSMNAAVELVGQELPEPAGGLFKSAYEQQKLGIRITDALATLQEKVDSLDFVFFITIIKINCEIGGNLSEILEKLAETIRCRLQIRRQVDVVTAEGRMSGYILSALPVVVFGLFYVMRPGYLDPFFKDRMCQFILAVTVFAQFVGFIFIRRIVNIRI